MIRVSHGVPIAYLDRFKSYSEMYLLLAHLVATEEEYRKFFYDSYKYKVMDNGAAELGKSFSESDLLDLAESVRANCIVAPDVIYDSEVTLDATLRFLHSYSQKIQSMNLSVMVVPQGKDLSEYLTCVYKLVDLVDQYPFIKFLGLSYISVPRVMSQVMDVPWERVECLRPYMVRILTRYFNLKHLKIHLLGCGNPIEYAIYQNETHVVSADSSIAFQFALNGTEVSLYYGYPRNKYLRADQEEKSFNFHLRDIDESTLNLAEKNMSTINYIAKGGKGDERIDTNR